LKNSPKKEQPKKEQPKKELSKPVKKEVIPLPPSNNDSALREKIKKYEQDLELKEMKL